MNIEQFNDKYESDCMTSGSQLFEKWEREKRLDELLNSQVAPGVVLVDLLNNEQFLDQIKPELVKAFNDLGRDKVYSVEEIRDRVYEMSKRGDKSVVGFMNKYVGQIGENEFLEQARESGIHARLAESGSQEGWDIVRELTGGDKEYLQVKFSNSPRHVIDAIEEVQKKIELGKISDGDEVVRSINFAVSANIYDEVQQEVMSRGYDIEIYSISTSNDDARDLIEVGFGFTEYTQEAVENLFHELFGSMATAAVIHTLANGFLLYKGAKNTREFWHATIDNVAISSGVLTAAMAAEILLTNVARVGGLPAYAIVISTAFVTRQFLKRLVNRHTYVDWQRDEIQDLNNLIASFS